MEHGMEMLQLVKVSVMLASAVVAFYIVPTSCGVVVLVLQLKLNNFFPSYQHHNAPPSSLLSMEECLLAEAQLPTPVILATL